MKIFKGKGFFLKSILLHIFLVLVISFVSVIFWEKPVFDAIINASTSTTTGSDEVSLVIIDNKSLDVHRWPWARSLYSEILEYFDNYADEKAVVFDIAITTLDKERPASSDQKFFDSVKKIDNFIAGYVALLNEYEDKNIGDNFEKDFYNRFSLDITDKRTKNLLPSGNYHSFMSSPKGYMDSIKYAGAANLTYDAIDGVLRSSTDLINYKDTYFPSLPLSAYLVANNTKKITLTNSEIIVDKTGLKIPYLQNEKDIRHRIKFYKIRPDTEFSHIKYSAIDIIESNKLLKEGKKPIIDPAEFKGKYVVIGGFALGIEDFLKTSVANRHPGPDIQATILDNFLHNDFLYSLTTTQNIMIIILMSIITFTVIRFMAFIPSLVTLITIAICYFILCLVAYTYNIIPFTITPLAVQLSTMIFGYSYRFILEGKNKEKIKNAMGKYLSQDIMQNVVQNIDDIKLGGKKANVTVLFADIRGFTSMSEKMTAEEVSVILNEYFSEIEPIITKYNGVINKFIGDAVMAIFGEPIQDINHPQNAVKCAYEMLKKVEELREKWLFEGKPKIEIGVGINTGEAFVGNIGSEKRLEYTVIGDMVNLASRIESYNKVYKTNLLISSSTYSQVSDLVDVIKIADVQIRGKAKKMNIYEVLRLS